MTELIEDDEDPASVIKIQDRYPRYVENIHFLLQNACSAYVWKKYRNIHNRAQDSQQTHPPKRE